MTDPGPSPHRVLRDQERRGRMPGTSAVQITTSEPPTCSAPAAPPAAAAGPRRAPSRSRRALGAGGVQLQLHEAAAERARLLGGRRRARRTRRRRRPGGGGGDRLQPRDPGAEHQHLRRAEVPAAVVRRGKNLGSASAEDQRRAVAGDGRHRGERVHLLRAGGARHQLHRLGERPPRGRRADGGSRPAPARRGGATRPPRPAAARRKSSGVSRSPSRGRPVRRRRAPSSRPSPGGAPARPARRPGTASASRSPPRRRPRAARGGATRLSASIASRHVVGRVGHRLERGAGQVRAPRPAREPDSVPRASGSQCGAPSPVKAGTK
jgi:hypothetical protein